jgi:hypothetical protein
MIARPCGERPDGAPVAAAIPLSGNRRIAAFERERIESLAHAIGEYGPAHFRGSGGGLMQAERGQLATVN